jgi:GNAT superfamily N-acetyltransferase
MCTLDVTMPRLDPHASDYTVREASQADAPVLARQRRLMFDETRALHSEEEGNLLEAAVLRYIVQAIPAGTFRSWIVEHDGVIVAGGGLQLRTLIPRPGYVYGEPEGLIVSMWTEPEHRRRGLGRKIVDAILGWGRANGITRFTLHASDAGRPLYELYGFNATNEMRLSFSSADSDAPILVERIS